MTQRIFLSFIAVVILLTQYATAQLPSLVKVEIEKVTVEFSNIKIMVSQELIQDSNGRHPNTLLALDKDKLYPPGTHFFISFDYKSNYTPSKEPRGIASLFVVARIGYQDGICKLDGNSGKGYVLLSGVSSNDSKKVEVATKLDVYGIRNDKSRLNSVTTNEVFRFTAKMDRLAMISETQFDTIKSMYRRLQELEARVKELESRQSN